MKSPSQPVDVTGGPTVHRCVVTVNNASRPRILLGMAAVFGLVHLGYWGAGVRFDATPLEHFWQYLDPVLLRDRLAESLLYLHVQPPLFNAFLGIVLQLGGDRAPQVFHAAYLGMGFGLYAALYSLMRRLDVTRPLAMAISTLFMVSPAFILYEHWLFYTLPLALLLVLSALALSNALRSNYRRQAVLFFSLLMILGATRSLFHLVWFLLMIGLLWWQSPGRRRAILVAALVPFILLLGLYGKNQVLFGHFGNSTWLGMNLWGVISRDVPEDEVTAMVAAGRLSPAAKVVRFSPLESYPFISLGAAEFAGIPAVSELRKSTGAVNYNHYGFIEVSDLYLKDAVTVIRSNPRPYIIGVAKAWFNYLQSSTDYTFLAGNRKRIAAADNLFNALLYGKLPYDLTDLRFLPMNTETGNPRYVYLLLAVGLPLLVVLTLRELWQRRLPRDRWVLLFYIWFTVCFVAFAGNALEVGENNRFRFMTDPLYATMLAVLLQRAIGARLRARSGTRGPDHGTR